MKKYIDKNVYEKAIERIEYLFNEFDNVLVSFSGGKDSGVCLNLCYDYAKEHNLLPKLGIVHLDYEAQYQMTTDYVDETFKKFNDIKRFWLCIPIHAQCCCNMSSPYWIPWEQSKKEIWTREMPNYDYVINEKNMEFKINPDDYEIPKDFFNWFTNKYGKTTSVIGIRATESYNRHILISSMNGNIKKYKRNNYIVDNVYNKDLFSAYPIYDWETSDIWIYNSKFGKQYNKLYDLFYQSGLGIEQMRVASPFNDCAGATLKLYKVIDPKNWGKMIGRVNGVNFMGLYGDTTAMGWKRITKPNHFTWKEYCYFLLNTLDEKTKQHYLDKLNTSIKFWKEKGGALTEETIKELEYGQYDFKNKGKSSKISDKNVISFEEYPDDLEVTNFKEVPTYKRMCVCIIKNDYYCKYMGFAQTKQETEKRKRAIEKYNNIL